MALTKTEVQNLKGLNSRRVRNAKAQIDQLAAQRLADIEQQLATVYAIDDEAWKEATDLARRAVDDANRAIREACEVRGIRSEFAPAIGATWLGRGQNAAAHRRAELRKVAKTRLDALAQAAKVEIESAGLAIETSLVSGSLETDEARTFLDAMPSPADLLPPLTLVEIEAVREGS